MPAVLAADIEVAPTVRAMPDEPVPRVSRTFMTVFSMMCR
jgi:hypothetical protein